MEKGTFSYLNSKNKKEETITIKNIKFVDLSNLIVAISRSIYNDGDYFPHMKDIFFVYYILKNCTNMKKSNYIITKKEENGCSTDEINWDFLFELSVCKEFEDSLINVFGQAKFDLIKNGVDDTVEFLISSGHQLQMLQQTVDMSFFKELQGKLPIVENSDTDGEEV